MKTLSLDLRQRVYDAYCQREVSVERVALIFGVSASFIYKLRRQQEALGHIKPLDHAGGNPPRLDEDQEQRLAQWVEQKPDSSLQELSQRMAEEQEIKVGLSTLSRVLRKLKLVRKKKEFCSIGTQ
jgi:transposase